METLDGRPPDTMRDALRILKAWESGQVTLSPDGIAVATYLQQTIVAGSVALETTPDIAI